MTLANSVIFSGQEFEIKKIGNWYVATLPNGKKIFIDKKTYAPNPTDTDQILLSQIIEKIELKRVNRGFGRFR